MSSTKAVLIVGGSGFVGTHLAMRLRDKYKVFATFQSHRIKMPGVTLLPGNVTNRNWFKRVIYTVRPDVIVYCAGSNSVERAEAYARDSESVHTAGAATIANIAEILSPKFIYLSNSHVFDGKRGNYHETDVVLPSTNLGKVKVGGENFIRGKCLHYVIVRSSPLIGRGNGLNLTFIDRLRMKLDRGERIEVPSNEIHSFAPVEGLVELVGRLIESGVRNKTLHFGGLTKLTHYEYARRFAKEFGYDPELISTTQAAHKLDYSLNSGQAISLLKIKPLLLEEGLDLINQNLISRL